ncbi:MAG TPA: hypothetical protein VFJ16_02070 [Longimicrobium sp.]|nr:hypothetical protein [Longimicrobium sp.]
MKKVKLSPEDLEVSSFAMEEENGGVNSMEAVSLAASCGCTTGGGVCYGSQCCSGPGCVQTYWDTCMTSNNSQC